MTFECVPGEGRIDVGDLRRALGPAAVFNKTVVITALGDDGSIVRAKVGLVDKRAGRSVHRRFACPSCGAPSMVLRVHSGQLTCGRCRPHLTEHQRQCFTRWWRHRDGNLVDQLIRLSLRRSAARRLERMVALAQQITDRDRVRLDALEGDVDEVCR